MHELRALVNILQVGASLWFMVYGYMAYNFIYSLFIALPVVPQNTYPTPAASQPCKYKL